MYDSTSQSHKDKFIIQCGFVVVDSLMILMECLLLQLNRLFIKLMSYLLCKAIYALLYGSGFLSLGFFFSQSLSSFSLIHSQNESSWLSHLIRNFLLSPNAALLFVCTYCFCCLLFVIHRSLFFTSVWANSLSLIFNSFHLLKFILVLRDICLVSALFAHVRISISTSASLLGQTNSSTHEKKIHNIWLSRHHHNRSRTLFPTEEMCWCVCIFCCWFDVIGRSHINWLVIKTNRFTRRVVSGNQQYDMLSE